MPSNPKKTNYLRFFGEGISIAGGVGFAKLLQLPHGLPASSFVFVCGPIAAIAGYEFGRWSAGRLQRRRAIVGGIFAILIVPIVLVLYYFALERSNPGLLTVVMLYLLFSLTFFSLFGALGALQVKILE